MRETDVFCAWFSAEKEFSHAMKMVIECKSTSAPWVAFYGGSSAGQDAVFPFVMMGGSDDCLCDETDDLYSIGAGDQAPVAYSILEKKGARSDRDLAREAVLAITSAAVAEVLNVADFHANKSDSTAHAGETILPIVVTKSPIFVCCLDGHGEVELSRVDSCWVRTDHEKVEFPIRVLVINYSAFKTFVSEFAAICRRLGFS
jgi:hypothetical protein